MTRTKWRIDPLHQETARAICNPVCPAPHHFHTFRQSGEHFLCAFGHAADFRDTSNIVKNVRQTRGLQVYYPRWIWQSFGQPGNSAVTDSANVAQFLSEDY